MCYSDCDMKKIMFLVWYSIVFLFIFKTDTYAKVLPRFRGLQTAGKVVATSGIGIIVHLKPDHTGILMYMSNLQNASSVSYMLSYVGSGQDQGAGGTIDIQGQLSLQRELLFATCSSGVCRYHSDISNAHLEITTVLKSGKQTVRRYRIRV